MTTNSAVQGLGLLAVNKIEGRFLYFASPRSHADTYGAIFSYGELQYAYIKNYWVIINQDKKPPKIVNEERAKITLAINPDNFIEITAEQYEALSFIDYKRVG